MKVLLYFEGQKMLEKSGIGRAFEHQKKALESAGIDYTTNARSKDYDILHINTYGINSRKMIKQAKKQGKKVIYHAHSNAEDFKNSFLGANTITPLYKKYVVSLYSLGDHLITPTPYAKRVLQTYGIQKPIDAVSNGINLEQFQPDEKKEEAFREYFKLAAEQKVIISVGLYFRRKGIIDFVEVARRFPQYKFIWFGHISLYSIPKDIRRIVQYDHPDNVIFPGYIKGDIIEGAYSNADLFFFPSYEETEGIVVLEALASLQNVLVRDIPVYDGWLKDRKNCYMGNNNTEFSQLLEGIVEKKLPDLSKNGWQTAQAKSIPHIGKKLQNIYETVLS
ncbi:1,2-diacylglycerol-3-glucose glucosyltransferase [Tetragenococcus halophilus subsp. halophilus]|uniref:1,2-diacylglycerol-3-glucose glucosyltransferase n=1 Tax=Tetragenococcus halophilus (strain DSM 20338 / JCM 20259 / NCIMB 9735 / NBRC 12172) TaxID=945021 RepID=A0AAN1SHS0_TETHN|nr:glycosyltransferase [Tetragenococcus halophilus]NWO01169.1 glycosyltransferase [Tetragenococcus halophilus]BAK95273.1 1,2-diacylglycerol-3-glucose glucosyltransferase [Tetragenococcus halophilus NBRC 12172]GBD71816.1 1,2-diacylglycerol-3-glucose glucosyltransferase [Tetragenococcus halophilus subsp. halophilus]GBD81346.1 1,2-diacylglycerol-3-glucose glucosyltransferase [Tetragenococcus halophilus subsp. halophilus]